MAGVGADTADSCGERLNAAAAAASGGMRLKAVATAASGGTRRWLRQAAERRGGCGKRRNAAVVAGRLEAVVAAVSGGRLLKAGAVAELWSPV